MGVFEFHKLYALYQVINSVDILNKWSSYMLMCKLNKQYLIFLYDTAILQVRLLRLFEVRTEFRLSESQTFHLTMAASRP